MNVGHVVISSYSDLSKLSSKVKSIHFRKFVSRKLIDEILQHCLKLKTVFVSKYASKRLNGKLVSYIVGKKLKIEYSDFASGRPNLLRMR